MMVNIGDAGSSPQVNRPSSISGIENDSSSANNYDGSPGSSSINGQESQRRNDDGRNTYTMSGVLHFLQHKWSQVELEKTQWEMEKAELKARISFLQGERKGQENLKRDLVRRIKMLEYSLKQERLKIYRLTHNGEDPEPVDEDEKPEIVSDVPYDVDAVQNPTEDPVWKQARLTLKQYMEEMGYSDGIYGIRAFRASKLKGENQENELELGRFNAEESRRALEETEKEILNTAEFLKKYNLRNVAGSDASNDDLDDAVNRFMDDDAVETVNDEFSFLNQEKEKVSTTKKAPKNTKPPVGAGDDWGIDETKINEIKERYRSEKEQKKRQSSLSIGSDKSHESEHDSGVDAKADNMGMMGSGAMPEFAIVDDSDDVDIKDDFAINEEDTSLSVKWNLKYTLRSHYDSVRALQFHPVDPVLITASEDGTAKLWNICDSKSSGGSGAQPPAGIMDVEPVYTFRGHEGAILAIDMSPTGDSLYTAGLDGNICCWQVPSVNIDIHDVYDPSVLQSSFTGHKDAVWSVNYHSSTNRLLSASADASIKVWDLSTTDENEYLLRTIENNDLIPRSMDIVSTEPQQIVVAYSGARASIVDIETGAVVLSFDFTGEKKEEIGEINKILSHPTMPVTVLAGNDRKIRYFDNHTGKLIYGAIAHVEAISTLAIDPNGLYLMSGSHDGSLRIWNMEQRKCLQEIAAHRKKYDMSVLSVAFHPSRPLIGSAGADSLAKIFTSLKVAGGNPQPVANEEETA